jgi:hypothetical protein
VGVMQYCIFINVWHEGTTWACTSTLDCCTLPPHTSATSCWRLRDILRKFSRAQSNFFSTLQIPLWLYEFWSHKEDFALIFVIYFPRKYFRLDRKEIYWDIPVKGTNWFFADWTTCVWSTCLQK